MSRLNRKFLISVFIVLFLVGTLSLYLNLNFIERYFLYQEKRQLQDIGHVLVQNRDSIEEAISEIEASEDVIIVRLKNSKDNNLLNQKLKEEFYNQGISLKTYWLWDQDQKEAENSGGKIRVYSQEKLNYSLLVEYISLDEDFIAVAKIIPSLDKTLVLINKITVIVFIGAGMLLFLCISVLVYKIIGPIKKIRETSKEIANLNFKTIEIHTNDELELLAEDINAMSAKLSESHRLLVEKNQQIESLLANVSHDLKTPISLIKMYACGMKDNLDDGTFLDTVIKQNDRMEKMVERLLDLSKVQKQECQMERVNVSSMLKELVAEYEIHSENLKTYFHCRVEDGIIANTNGEALYLVFSNMISNAVKYSKDGCINIKLCREDSMVVFSIENAVRDASEILMQRIWEPFYVAEKSRNKSMSGTGLGLSIVKAVCEKYNIEYESGMENDFIYFIFRIGNCE